MPRYEIRDAASGRILGKHRTRQAAMDNWKGYSGTPIEIVRTYSDGLERIVVEGIWHPEGETRVAPAKKTRGF